VILFDLGVPETENKGKKKTMNITSK